MSNQTLMATSEQNTSKVIKSDSSRLSAVRGCTMKEYNQQISDLKKENFSLKMRIYFMEERMQQKFGDGQDVFKKNIELQMQVDNLKQELMDKQVLVQKAALAIDTMTAKHAQEEENTKNQLQGVYEQTLAQLHDQLDKANLSCERSQKEVEDAKKEVEALKHQLDVANTEQADSNRAKEELSSKVKSAEIDIQALCAQLKSSEQAKAEINKENALLSQKLNELEDQLQEACKKCSDEGTDGKIRDVYMSTRQDTKASTELLQQGISSLVTLHLHARCFDNPGEGVSTKDPVTEILPVQQIYRHLEEGLDQGNELHHSLVNNLSTQHGQYGTLVNSFQDEEFNRGSSHCHSKQKRLSTIEDMEQTESGSLLQIPVKTVNGSVQSGSLPSLESEQISPSASQVYPVVIDRSQQTGTSLSQINQLKTSLRDGESEEDCAGERKGSNIIHDQVALSVPSGYIPATKCKVSFVDFSEDLRCKDMTSYYSNSVTDDTKDEFLGKHAECLEKIHNFQHDIFFDESHFDSRRYDRASSTKFDSLHVSSPKRTNSVHITPSCSINSSCGSIEAINDVRFLYHHGNDHCLESQTSVLMNTSSNNGAADYCGEASNSGKPDGNGCMPGVRSHSENVQSDVKSCGNVSLHCEVLTLPSTSKNGQLNTESHNSVTCISVLHKHNGGDGGDFCNSEYCKTAMYPKCSPKNSSNSSASSGGGKPIGSMEEYLEGSRKEDCMSKELAGKETAERKVADITGEWTEKEDSNQRNFSLEEQNDTFNNKPDNSLDETKSKHQSKSDQHLHQHSHHHSKNQQSYQHPLSVELRNTVNETYSDLVGAASPNAAFQKHLENPNILDRQVRSSFEGSIHKPLVTDHKENESNHTEHCECQSYKCLRKNSCHSATCIAAGKNMSNDLCNSELYSGMFSNSVGQQRVLAQGQLFRNAIPSKISKLPIVSGSNTDLYQKLSESYCQIKDLEKKLQATENTVRLFSKRNKTYLSVMKANGLSVSLMNRSNSETCLDSFSRSLSARASSFGNLSSWTCGPESLDSNATMSHQTESIERARSHFCSTFCESVNVTCHSPATSLMATPCVEEVTQAPSSPDETSDNILGSTVQSSFNNFDLTVSQNSSSQIYGHVVTMNNSHHAKSSSNVNVVKSMPVSMDNTLVTSPKDSLYKPKISHDGHASQTCYHKSPTQQNILDHKSPKKDAGLGPDQSSLSSNVLNQSRPSDVTYSSILNNTSMNQLWTNLEHSLSSPREVTLNISGLTVEQLQICFQHFERVNLALKEEIGIYEALQHLQFNNSSRKGNDTEISENLLKQHLIEIRKLRQRLERLDITTDSDQLIIFQSHTYQRISRQEKLIAHLQQQMMEKEQQWQRQLSELQHKLCREKTLMVEKLELTINELQTTIKSQTEIIKEQERQLMDLKLDLNVNICKRRKKVESKIMEQKTKLEADIIKQDKEFLEEDVFKLELAKRNNVSENRLESETEKIEVDFEKLRMQVENGEKSSVYLEEKVVKYEKSLQEKVALLQKLTNEKAASDYKLEEREGQVKTLESELDILRNEMQEMKAELEERTELKTEIDILKEELKKRGNLQARTEFQRMRYEEEFERFTAERRKLRTQLESESEEKEGLKYQINNLEHELAKKITLEKQISKLKEEIKSMSGLQYEAGRLNIQVNQENKLEAEMSDKQTLLINFQSEVKMLREKLVNAENSQRVAEELRKNVLDDLKGREEKLKTREKQLHHLFGQYKKLDAAFTKQQHILKEKLDLVQSMKRQIHLYEISLTCSSAEEKDSTLKQLLKEIISARRQLEDLLTGLEQTSAELKLPVASTIPQTSTESGIHNLFAVLKQDCHDKLHKNVGECLVILTSMEKTLEDKLGMYNSLLEDMEYSSLRDNTVSCQRLRMHLEEAARMIATAWVTELSPNDIRQNVLCEKNKFRHEIQHSRSCDGALDEQGKQRTIVKHRAWETILYRQLYKTAQNLQQAKKNFDTSLASLPPSLKH